MLAAMPFVIAAISYKMYAGYNAPTAINTQINKVMQEMGKQTHMCIAHKIPCQRLPMSVDVLVLVKILKILFIFQGETNHDQYIKSS